MDRVTWWATYSPWSCKESDMTEHTHTRGIQDWEHSVLRGKTGRIGIKIVRYFQDLISWAQFLNLLISSKSTKIFHGDKYSFWLAESLKRLAEMSRKICALLRVLSLYENHIYWPTPHPRLFGAVSQNYMKCFFLGCSSHFAQIKLNSQNVCHFFKSTEVTEKLFLLF